MDMYDFPIKVDTATGASPPREYTREAACSPIRFLSVDQTNVLDQFGLKSLGSSSEQRNKNHSNGNRYALSFKYGFFPLQIRNEFNERRIFLLQRIVRLSQNLFLPSMRDAGSKA